MATGVENVRRGGLRLPSRLLPGDPLTKGISDASLDLDKQAGEKGLFAESTVVRGGERRKKAEKEQAARIKNQSQLEGVRLAEAESEIARRRLLTRQGGRRQLAGGSSTGGSRLSTSQRQTLVAR